jgi:Leucine-rich repeat (LRR) protein
MLTSTAVVIFLFSTCMAQGSGHCPEKCKCTTDGRDVECSGKHLESLPQLQASNITSLDVSFNNISLILPHDFDVSGIQLKYLYLGNNRIKVVEKLVFSKLPALTHIHLDHNLITQLDSYTFDNNHNLWKLILNENSLTLPEDTGILNAPSLGWIELENCNISYLPVNLFKNMSKLVFIRLSNNQIQQLDLQLFSHLNQLRYLHLEGNQIQEIHPDLFKSNHKLEWLYLRHNPLNQFSGDHFLHAPSLISLDISFCNISQIPNNYLSNLHNLMNLRLNNNILKSFNMTHIPKNLEALDISGNSMRTINMRKHPIRHMTNIKYLDLTNNEFTCDCHLFGLWMLCARLRNRSGGMSSCDEFCPAPKFKACKGEHSEIHQVQNTSEHFNVSEPKRKYEYINTTMEEIDVHYKTSDTQQNNDVDTFGGVHNDSKDANDKTGKYKVNGERVLPDLGLPAGRTDLWTVALYACIGVFGGLCLIGVTVLGAELLFGRRKRSRKSAANCTLQRVRMEPTERSEERQETVPLSQHRGFDFAHVPRCINRTGQEGQL